MNKWKKIYLKGAIKAYNHSLMICNKVIYNKLSEQNGNGAKQRVLPRILWSSTPKEFLSMTAGQHFKHAMLTLTSALFQTIPRQWSTPDHCYYPSRDIRTPIVIDGVSNRWTKDRFNPSFPFSCSLDRLVAQW